MISALFSSLGVTAGIAGLGAGGAIALALFLGATFRTLALAAGLAAALATGIYATGYIKGGSNCRNAYELAAARARALDLGRQLNALHSTLARQNKLDAARIKEMAEDDLRISQLEALLSARGPVDACPVAATARELRALESIGSGRAGKAPSSSRRSR